jgi:hypothetical protein
LTVNLDQAPNPTAHASAGPTASIRRRRRHSETMSRPALPPPQRIAIAAVIALIHLLLLLAWIKYGGPAAPAEPDTIEIIFLAPTPTPPAPEPIPPMPRPSRPTETATREPPRTLPRRGPSRPLQAVEVAPSTPAPRVQLFRDDGSIDLPSDVLDALENVTGDDRVFDYQVPGLAASRRLLERRPALEHEATRFDENWASEQDLLTSALQTAVEKTTVGVKIPIPRAPGTYLTCKASLAVMGGACGFVSGDDGYVVELDDPNTLNPEQDQQCRDWWEQIVNATSQSQWRQLRQQYEQHCRKPLAVSDQVPD